MLRHFLPWAKIRRFFEKSQTEGKLFHFPSHQPSVFSLSSGRCGNPFDSAGGSPERNPHFVWSDSLTDEIHLFQTVGCTLTLAWSDCVCKTYNNSNSVGCTLTLAWSDCVCKTYNNSNSVGCTLTFAWSDSPHVSTYRQKCVGCTLTFAWSDSSRRMECK